jgi:hypothetical protein
LALFLAMGSTMLLAVAFVHARHLPSLAETFLLLLWLGCHASALVLFLVGLFQGARGGGVAAKATLATYFSLLITYAAVAICLLSTAS